MNAQETYAERHPESTISKQECQAMRALSRDDEYTRREIAFVFGCQVPTVRAHVERECPHIIAPDEDSRGPDREYSDEELITAFQRVRDKQPFKRMSQNVYDKHRPDEYPAAITISRWLGGWKEAREKAGGFKE